jgi:hypothetical protein
MEKLTNKIIRGLYNVKNEAPEYSDLIRLIVKVFKRICELDVVVRNVQNSVNKIPYHQEEWSEKSILAASHGRPRSLQRLESIDKYAFDEYGISKSENDFDKPFRSDCYWYFN